jgi:hypothetical protein
MGIFDRFKKQENVQIVESGYQSFSTPFLKVGGENLSLPYIQTNYGKGYVYFGNDNLYPQLLNQIYYMSPLHGAIVDFKTNSAIGGGYTFDETKLSAKDKVDLYSFAKTISIDRTLEALTKELVLHGRVYFSIKVKNGKKRVERISPEKVRTNKDKSCYWVNDDWAYQQSVKTLTPYRKDCGDGEYIFVYEDYSVGQDVYPIPQYTSALNFAFLSGELSYMQKANIQNSIFPSFAMMFPKRPQSKEEIQEIKDTVYKLKGAENAGKAVAFFANNKEQLPELVNLPVNDNDKLFSTTSELNTEQICFAHTIDPILLGVRTTGSLGSGSDIKQAYIIFEKNVVMPLRGKVENIFNMLLTIVGLDARLTINNFQIVNETITEVDAEGSAVTDALNAMSPLVATKVLESMTVNEIRAMAALPPVEDGDAIRSQIPPAL